MMWNSKKIEKIKNVLHKIEKTRTEITRICPAGQKAASAVFSKDWLFAIHRPTLSSPLSQIHHFFKNHLHTSEDIISKLYRAILLKIAGDEA